MKAYLLMEAGDAGQLYLQDVPVPEISAEEVLVAVKAISINPADVKVRGSERGLEQLCGSERPVILGWDIAGVVKQVGAAVSDFQIGDEVFGMVNFPGRGNAYAEMVAAPAAHLAKIPANISFEEAAATTLAALTAWQVLAGRIKSDDRVLIQAGSGGVGHFAIQIAKTLGAWVATTASGANQDFVLEMGADCAIDYQSHHFEVELTDIDFVLDGIGGKVLENSIKVMRKGGEIICLPQSEFSFGLQSAADNRQVSLGSILVTSSGEDMRHLANLLAKGTLKPQVYKIFSFEDLPLAHEEVEKGRVVGKVIVRL
ncbi:NADP-dependent oxidoreductase [Persicobacter sp. CCB-QB2]|uniref:NADP-dependent oxidoreductase n=1 Tax=Persicobacter sp. CCB-QB2 TaxID=1561025 RepID=UPI0006A9FA1E|nr:NADP-dependent oxidoreductase [Persicobacter sp. CCB-QB2]